MTINNGVGRGFWIGLFTVLGLLGLQLAMRPWFGGAPPASLFLIAVMMAVWSGGLYPGLAATLLAVLATAFFLQEPFGTLRMPASTEQMRLLVLASSGGILSLFLARIRARERRREQQLLDEIALRRRAEHQRSRLLEEERAARGEAEAARAALTDALDLAESLFATAPVGLGYIDLEFRYVRVNEAMAHLNRLPAAEHVGRTVAELLFEVYDAERILLSLQQVLDRNEPVIDLQLPGDDQEPFGVFRSFNLSFFPVHQGSAIVGIGVVVEETTERRQAEADIRKLNFALSDRVTELETLFDFAPVGLLLAEERDCRHILMNKAFAAMVGTSQVENPSFSDAKPEPQVWRIFRNGQSLAPEELPVQRSARLGEPVSDFDLEYRLPGGRRIRAAIHAVPLFDARGEVRGAIGAVVDQTERLALEESLRLRTAQMEIIDLHKDEILANLAYEFRTPLSALGTAVALLSRSNSDEPEQLAALEIIDRQIGKLGRLVDNLLEGAMDTHGKIRLDFRPLVVADLIERAEAAAASTFKTRRLSLQTELPPRSVQVLGDEVRLILVLTNLLMNAAKFSHEEGCVRLGTEIDKDELAIRVRDEGHGLPNEHLRDIFDPFTRCPEGEERHAAGLGIGLLLEKRLVEMHGGRVQALSEGEGKGSEFVIWLPLFRAAAHQPTALGATLNT